MKIEHWRFLAPKSDPATLIRDVLKRLEPHCHNPTGDYCAISIDGLRTTTSQHTEKILDFLMRNGGGVRVNLPPEGWTFFVEFSSIQVGAPYGSKCPMDSCPEAGWFEITASTDAIWKDATLQDRLIWDDSLEFLAMTVITTVKPKWGVRLHEWDYDYISETDISLFQYPLELWRGEIPRLLGRITYLDQALYSKACFGELLKSIELRPLASTAGGFLVVNPANWVEVLGEWSSKTEKGFGLHK